MIRMLSIALARAAVPAAALSTAFIPVAAQSQAADWEVNRGASEIGFSGTNAGRAFNGTFEQWTARIRFDPNNLAQSRIIVVIDTASATTGDRVQETTLENAEWFDSENHRFARFTSNNITARGGNRYSARGTLEIRGKQIPVTLPFTATINGNSARASGSVALDRIALGMGTKSDPKADLVSRNIDLAVRISATKG